MESVAIIILTKNNFEVIKKCLDSFKEKNTYNNIKFYIGDTGSTDTIYNKLSNFCDSYPYKKEIVKFNYYNFAKNHNWIIKNRVKEKYILFCNDDIELTNDALTIMVDNINDRVGTVGCKLLFPDKTIQHAGQIHIIDKNKDIFYASHKFYKQVDRELPNEYNVGNTFAFCLTKRDTYLDVGGLNEQYIQCFEDVDYNICCSLKNLKHKFVGSAICIHHESISRKKTFAHAQQLSDNNNLKNKMKELYYNE